MEILNNIWTALSTPNEGLLNILAIPATLMENFLLMTLFISFLNISATKKQKFIYTLIMSLSSLFNMYVLSNPFNIIFNYFIMITLAYLVFKFSLLQSILSVVGSTLIFNIFGFLILNPYLTILNISTEQLNTIPIYRFIYIGLMYTFLIVITLIFKIRHFKIIFVDDIDKKSKIIIFLNFGNNM